ncbi:hypothetical protein [Demequina muriae]|uniref:Lipoprotein n=1 Tax=Demequina muriae TaxID=3051664 RepID=A0ABT8GHQ3_9MICO|nr:hypothetical protein [Demequina sp. EGI L300058]MDN4480963.1 hypothetical protein [Demequina sp. EGI L300058]
MNTMLRILAPVTAASLVLAGCGAADNLVESAMEEAVEKGVEGATGADVEAGEDGFSVTTEDGEFTVGGDGSLPEGFPEAEVPLVDGEIGQTARVNDGDADAFAVSINATGSVEEVHAEALGLLESAGFTVSAEVDMGGMKSATLESEGSVDAVTLGVLEGSDESMSTVNYTVVMARE